MPGSSWAAAPSGFRRHRPVTNRPPITLSTASGAPAGRQRPVHAARWRRAHADAQRLSQQRSRADHRLRRGGRNARFQGFHDAARVRRSVSQHDGARRHARTVPAAARRRDRVGRAGVPSWLRRLDVAQHAFARTEPGLALPLKASDYVRRQIKFTPHPTEPVGWIIEQAGAELLLFSSDYPHIEGGRNPLKRFDESTVGISEAAKERFYAANFNEMMG